MFLVESKAGAIACMLLSLLLLGTWPAILTLLERRGRLPQHTYLDYSITNFLAAVVIALTFGQIGDSKPNMPNFITQLSQDTWPCVLMAMLGGLFLSLGNVSIQYAWAFVGLSVAQVITSSIAVVIGTSLNYFLDDKINKASILFPGVACFLTAVLLGATVHSSNAADNVAKLRSFHENMKDTPDVPEESNLKGGKSEKDILEDIEVGDLNAEETKKAGTAESIIAVENQRAIKALPLVSTFWGVIFFGEYRRSSKRTYVYLVSMLLLFSVAVALLLASAGHRKTASNGSLKDARHLQHSRRQSAIFYADGSFDM